MMKAKRRQDDYIIRSKKTERGVTTASDDGDTTATVESTRNDQAIGENSAHGATSTTQEAVDSLSAAEGKSDSLSSPADKNTKKRTALILEQRKRSLQRSFCQRQIVRS